MCDPCCPTSNSCCLPASCIMSCDPCPPKRCKSRELRSSILMTSCDCVKRNGLQLDCPRAQCQGRPLCGTKPIPDCCPSKYMWRYANVTMGKPAFGSPKKVCCPRATGACNPCVIDCSDCCL